MFVNRQDSIDEIMEVIKEDLKGYLRIRLRAFDPELLPFLNKKIINQAHIYTRGYSDSLKEHVSLPVNKQEMQLFLFERTFEYVKQEILNQK